MGRIEADIALLSCLFGFRPCLGQGQFTLCLKNGCSNAHTRSDNQYLEYGSDMQLFTHLITVPKVPMTMTFSLW